MSYVKPRALFILKRREDYSVDLPSFTDYTIATGMYNSVRFVVDMLNDSGVEAKQIVVIDNNDIDREVTKYKPTHVFIEGYWVVPEKFDVLKPLHPKVKWYVRCHSELPFLSQEGIAMTWTYEYFKRGVGVAGNSPRISSELTRIRRWADNPTRDGLLTPELPNYYPVALEKHHQRKSPFSDTFDIGCFGAIRPLKNHLVQAMAAMDFASHHGRKLRFHVNVGRIEMNGANSIKNLRALFNGANENFELVEHPWMPHDKFLDLIRKMDMVVQVSFTETFNIVAADAANLGVPIVVSKEIPWCFPIYADPTSTEGIRELMNNTWLLRDWLEERHREAMREYVMRSRALWLSFFGETRYI
jgi:hypothetical protein